MFIPQTIFTFLKTPQNIEIQNFEPQKMIPAYVCMKMIYEYPPLPGVRTSLKKYLGPIASRGFSTSISKKTYEHLSRGMKFPTMWYVRPPRPQISLRIHAV